MINELYELTEAIKKADFQTESWHKKYKPIPNIRSSAPCVCIRISGGKVTELSYVSAELGAKLRKYGSNQGSYPCMNLAPLYRIAKDALPKVLPEALTPSKIEELHNLCRENNWGKKFQDKYKISMQNVPAELMEAVPDYTPLKILIEESKPFAEPSVLHRELEEAAFRMLNSKENIELALRILFYSGNPQKEANDDYGSLSVALESSKLIEMGKPAVSPLFVEELNNALLQAASPAAPNTDTGDIDAFGKPFVPNDEPMPAVKLAGGFDAKLRTMFHEQRCQTRYGRIENASYPISPQMQTELSASLNWLGSTEQKEKTWVNTDKGEILFVYPTQLPQVSVRCTRMFKRPAKNDGAFSTQAKRFIEELQQSKKPENDSRAENIRLFILRKIDKARSKVVYTRQTDPHELERCSELWTIGCQNLPGFPFGSPLVPFPLDISDILNHFWKQNGETATNKFKPVPKYHGLELLMDVDLPVTADLHTMAEKAMTLGAFIGGTLASVHYCPIQEQAKDMLALIGLLLYRKGIRKEIYMEQFPFLYGQLLKALDELHTLYCNVVRNGDLPTQLVGSSMYQSAAEAPFRTMNILAQRASPYISWAKSYRTKGITEKGKESWKAGWLLSLCESIASKLNATWSPMTRFNDEEKAQFFIGYLAAFPQKEQPEETTNSGKI